MRWSRELKIARRSLRTAMKAASAIAQAQARLPAVRQPRLREAPLPGPGGLREIADFGSNPGRLSMFTHTPAVRPAPGAPLIVLLHGCGQSAAEFARDAGWMALADEIGVPLVLPEQCGENNHGRCFNWFRPSHVSRGLGEVLSIRQMVGTAIDHFGSDPRRVYVAGLSAGGAMTAALLAAYPEMFEAGAVVAGLPVGAASSASEALRRMAEAGPERSPAAWAEVARRAGSIGYSGPWPRLSIWHGEADNVVDSANGRLLAGQWSALHDIDFGAGEIAEFPGAVRVRCSRNGLPVVEHWSLPAHPHIWPKDAVRKIAGFWELGTG